MKVNSSPLFQKISGKLETRARLYRNILGKSRPGDLSVTISNSPVFHFPRRFFWTWGWFDVERVLMFFNNRLFYSFSFRKLSLKFFLRCTTFEFQRQCQRNYWNKRFSNYCWFHCISSYFAFRFGRSKFPLVKKQNWCFLATGLWKIWYSIKNEKVLRIHFDSSPISIS